jgi:hypothetical protein
MIFNHPLRGTCNPECGMYGLCHDDCGERTTIAPYTMNRDGAVRGMPRVWRSGHNQKVQRSGAYHRTGVPIRLIMPDLEQALRLCGSMTNVSLRLGMNKGRVSAWLTGETKKTTWGTAQRLAVLVRGSRHIADDVARKEKGRINQANRRARQKAGLAPDSRRAWRESREGGDHVCTTCGSSRATPHALYLHAFNAHGDRSQGKSAWGKAVVA